MTSIQELPCLTDVLQSVETTQLTHPSLRADRTTRHAQTLHLALRYSNIGRSQAALAECSNLVLDWRRNHRRPLKGTPRRPLDAQVAQLYLSEMEYYRPLGGYFLAGNVVQGAGYFRLTVTYSPPNLPSEDIFAPRGNAKNDFRAPRVLGVA